jgi:hypothetical protein
MTGAIIASVDQAPAPLRIVLGSQALESTLATLRKRRRLRDQSELAASADFPPGEQPEPAGGDQTCVRLSRNPLDSGQETWLARVRASVVFTLSGLVEGRA